MPSKPSHAPLARDERARRAFRWRPREIGDLLLASGKEFAEDKAPKQSAALAYYTLFALGPLLVLAIAVASLAFGAEAAREAILAQASRVLGPTGTDGVRGLLEGADRERAGAVGAILGTALLLVAAGAVFGQLKEALNRIWEVEAEKVEGWKAKVAKAVRKNLFSFVSVVGTGFLLLVSLLASALLASVGGRLAGLFPGALPVVAVLNVALALVVFALVFAAMFKFIPDVRIAWRDTLVGAGATSVLFYAGQVALGVYLGAGPLGSRYGVAGALIIVLAWVYYSGMIVFFGAELTQVYANRYGSRVRAADDARALREAAQEQDLPEEEGARRPARGSRRPQA